MMFRNKIIKRLAITAVIGLIVGGGITLYMFNMPQRNISEASVDYAINAGDLVAEYLADYDLANKKYLASDGNSKILLVAGTVANISTDYSGQKVVLLKEDKDKAGINTTFSIENTDQAEALKVGQQVNIKGVIRSGANYDEDLELYENVVLDKASVQ